MKPVIRSILTPIVIVVAVWGLAQLYIRYEEGSASRQTVSEPSPPPENILALRVAAVDAAKNRHQLQLATEKQTYEQEKKEADYPEIAELSHEVRILRIDLELQTALAGIDKKYPPPHPVPVRPRAP